MEVNGERLIASQHVELEESSTNSIPNELLLVIFEFVVAEPSTKNDFHIPIRLSQVSTHWRTLALHNPSLWTNVHLNLSYQTTFFLASRFLDRSNLLPVHIIITATVPFDRLLVERSISFVRDQLPRCRSLTISSPYVGYITRLTTLVSFPAPKLQNLEIDYCSGHERVQFLRIDYANGMSPPPLRRVRLTAVVLPWEGPSLSNLTTFEIGGLGKQAYTVSQLRCFFANNPCLDTLIIGSQLLAAEDVHPKVEIPSLRSLKLTRCTRYETPIQFAISLSTPGLTSLVIINDPRQPGDGGWSGFVNYVKGCTIPCYPSLASLILRGVPVSMIDAEFTKSSPALTDLVLLGDNLSFDFLLPPRVGGGDRGEEPKGCPWPKLENLRCEGRSLTHHLREVLEFRRTLGFPVSSVAEISPGELLHSGA
ncbi:hypothetical protein JAAARDRAFT_187319 [Jaapia argillacea MUCL 33604]|uniref:F-box domain-containing protein n=1 Tax=Jaapia argillacea MUCL 33604 TaxID=933084 RepID=A0A067QMU9_9AGAM|nr:hypothetical protein JAAARDRAFT_187319 [Jaapia argillacea MUCL 33604]